MTAFAQAQLLRTMAAENAGSALAAEAKAAMADRQIEQTNVPPGWREGARNRAATARAAVEHYRARERALNAAADALTAQAAEAGA